MKLAFGDGHHHFPAHHLALMVGIAVIFSSQVMPIAAERLMGCKFFKPALVIMVQSWLARSQRVSFASRGRRRAATTRNQNQRRMVLDLYLSLIHI